VDAQLVMPRLPDTDMTVEGWAAPIRAALEGFGPDDVVVGHSFGASILVTVLAESRHRVSRAVLLAMPNWGPDGWQVDDYAPSLPSQSVHLVLHHCADDSVVPLSHLRLNGADLPRAVLHTHETGGHQFDGLAATLLA
jgi:predicted alpha/beta hydrolase family esterase